MEFNKIEALLEKYFDGETSVSEENELKNYFTSSNVVEHLQQYKPLFGYFVDAEKEKFEKRVSYSVKNNKRISISVAASIVVLFGVGIFNYYSTTKNDVPKELGTYDDPEKALEATQKALTMLSNNVNVGVEGMQYIQVYEQTKNKVFIQ
ncbi:hypothetical protein [Flavobacterium adhaerens]|uniref:hypothetical protein n=1 Tax=Flavobacterium adhaerens TaxID=3149043 RepID=UPI0032B564DF